MADLEALFRITYGLYIVCSGNNKNGNGFISNTVFQVTSQPAKFAVCCNKDNLTAEFISRHEVFSVSVLDRDTPAEIFSTFGYKSGKEVDKLTGRKLIYGETGVPVILDSCIAWLELKLVNTFDAGTHLIFIGELVNATIVDNVSEPITYTYYRQERKAFAPKNAPTYIDQATIRSEQSEVKLKKFQCPECGYIYDEEIEKVLFTNLPDDWICPVCGTPKSDFEEITKD